MDLFDLSGEVAFVTGAGSGIGQAIAKGLACAGAAVLLYGRDGSAGLDETAHAISETGGRAIPIRGDVRSVDDLENAASIAEKELGPLTIGINNAGVARSRSALEMTGADWNAIHDVNVLGVFFSSQMEGKRMLTHGRGSIVNVASISAHIAHPGIPQAHYNSSKSAVRQLSRSLAVEWGEYGIRVNSLSPGFTMTPMNARPEVADSLRGLADATPLRRLAEPSEMVGPAIFLASPASSFVTGIDLLVDGGWVSW